MDKIIRFLILIPIVLLLLALTRMPYGYYDVMRVVVSLAALVFIIRECTVVSKYKIWERVWPWSLVFIGIMILFNPLAPFRFPRQTWTLFNISAATLWFVYFFTYEFKLKDKTKDGSSPIISPSSAQSSGVTKGQGAPLLAPTADGRPNQSIELKVITGLYDHSDLLRKALRTAKSSVIIASPYLSQNAMNSDQICERISAAVARNVNVGIICNSDFNDSSQGRVQEFNECVKYLKEAKAEVYDRSHHSKFICVDSEWLVIGSFNWLSSARNPNSTYSWEEVSLKYSGKGAAGMISELRRIYEV